MYLEKPKRFIIWNAGSNNKEVVKSSKLSISFLQAAEQSLKALQIFEGGVADTLVSQYSGGMKRRLSVAISLIGDPKVKLVLCSYPWSVK